MSEANNFQFSIPMQFAALNSSRIRLKATDQSPNQINRRVLAEPVSRFESLRCARFGWEPESGWEVIEPLLQCILSWSKKPPQLSPEDLTELRFLLPVDGVGGVLRERPGPPLFGQHPVLSPELVERGLSRFFEWVSSDSYAEIHPVEQATLCQLRLLEISPFSSYNHLVAIVFSYSFLSGSDYLWPTYQEHEMAGYATSMLEALSFSTAELVELNLRACLRSYDQILSRPVQLDP